MGHASNKYQARQCRCIQKSSLLEGWIGLGKRCSWQNEWCTFAWYGCGHRLQLQTAACGSFVRCGWNDAVMWSKGMMRCKLRPFWMTWWTAAPDGVRCPAFALARSCGLAGCQARVFPWAAGTFWLCKSLVVAMMLKHQIVLCMDGAVFGGSWGWL